MKYFHLIEGEQAILRSNGVFKQVDLYERGDEIYAKHGSGYVRLMDNYKTTAPKVFWSEMSLPTEVGAYGRLLRK